MKWRSELVAGFLFAGLAAAIAAPVWDVKDGTIFPPKKAELLLRHCSRNGPTAVTEFWLPQLAQIAQLELALPDLLETKLSGERHPPIKSYKRQYAGLIVKGRKIIYVNGFAGGDGAGPGTWRTDPVKVCDGGNGFFGVEYDPEKKSFEGLAFNGVA